MMRIEEAVVHDLARAPSAPPIERVRRRARRRRARIWAAGIISVIAIAACVTVGARSLEQPSRIAVRPAVGHTTASDVVIFNDNGGVSAVNFAARTITHLPLAGWRSGDQPFLSLTVGTDLVAGWGDVYATPLAGGPTRLLGVGVLVPAVEPGAVWLTSYGDVQIPTERLVDMHGKVLLQGPTPRDSAGRAYVAITGVPGGLAVQTENGLGIWNARTGRITRRLGSGPGITALPMSGSELAWCDRCDRGLELTDLTTGVTRSIAVSFNGDFLVTERYFAFSPDGTRLAIPAQPDGAAPYGATTKIIIVNVTTGKVVSQFDTRARYATIAWSPDSKRLYIAASDRGSGGRVLLHDEVTNTTRDLGSVPDRSGSFSAIITSDQAALFPTATAATADTCPGPSGPTTPKRPCTYSFAAP